MLLTLLLACATAHTVSSLAQVTPGGSEAEFYALVRTEHWDDLGQITAVDVTLIRCVSPETGMERSTTCRKVLTGEEAIRAAAREAPITFGPTK